MKKPKLLPPPPEVRADMSIYTTAGVRHDFPAASQVDFLENGNVKVATPQGNPQAIFNARHWIAVCPKEPA